MISGGLFVQKRSVYHCQSFPAVYSQSGSFVSRVAIIRPPPKTSLHFYSCCVRPHSSGDKCALYVAKSSVILTTSRVTVLRSLRMFNNLVQPNTNRTWFRCTSSSLCRAECHGFEPQPTRCIFISSD